jgi:hypothetical protein
MGLSHTQTVLLIAVGITVAAAAVGGTTIGFGGQQPLQVDSVDTRTTAESDAVFTVDATLNNTGTANVTRSVGLQIDANGNGTAATTVTTRTVTIPSETTRRVSFEVSPEAIDPGPLTYAVVIDQEPATRETGTVVLDRPTFAVTDSTSPNVVRGEQASVTATLHNEGHFEGTKSVDLRLDRDGDGTFSSTETAAASPMIAPDDSATVEFTVDTQGLQPGTYMYRLVGPVGITEGTLTVMQPATFRFEDTNVSTTAARDNASSVIAGNATDGNSTAAVRGDVLNVTTTVRNDGDVAGTETVRFDPPEAAGEPDTQEIRVDGDSLRTLQYTLNTTALARGNYSMNLTVANETQSLPLRVYDSNFEVTTIRGQETLVRGEDLQFEATVRNTGDAADNQSVEFRIDLDDEDGPEYTVERYVALAPGEQTTVQFTAPYAELESNTSERLLGSHVYGIYSGDENTTAVVAYEPPQYSSSDTGSTGGSTDDSTEIEPATLDEITQEKYGYDYDQVSGETRRQIAEVHERQPFADGLAVTEVRTREEIARQEFGLDVEPGDRFNFTAIDVQTQQEIEAIFDAQFQSDTGDRIESWDELARQQYDSDYDALSADQQQAIREQYTAQFEES